MVRRNSTFFRLSLVAVLFGLYALSMTSWIHASEAERCAVITHTDPAAFDANPLESGHLRQVSHHRTARALLRTSALASLFKSACIVTPDFSEARLARENVLALGDAPHAPGSGRAPPAA